MLKQLVHDLKDMLPRPQSMLDFSVNQLYRYLNGRLLAVLRVYYGL